MASDGVITHRSVDLNGVRLHVAEAGPAGAPVVLLLHGFPELWYTWRHQMPALAAAGYRAVAPDMRSYGDSDAPSGGPEQYTALHVVGDLVALIDSLGEKQVFVVVREQGLRTRAMELRRAETIVESILGVWEIGSGAIMRFRVDGELFRREAAMESDMAARPDACSRTGGGESDDSMRRSAYNAQGG